jgi:MFS family permease
MQGVMGTSALLAGLALAAMAVAWPVGGFIGSRLMLWCSYRISATIGGVILVTGSLVMMALGPTVVPAWAITGALLIGFGIGITNICFVVSVQSAVDQNQRGSATSSLSFMRIVGQSLGAAIFGGMLNIGLAGVTENGIDLMGRMMRAGPRQGLDAAMGAFTHSLHSMYLVNGLLALVVLGSVLALPSGLNLIRQGDRHR